MSIFDSLNNQPKQQVQQAQPRMTPQQAMQQLRADPAGTLKAAGLNIPDGMNDPQQIVNHLLQSGQVSNPRLQMAQRMMGMFARR